MNNIYKNRAILNLFTQKLNQNEIFSLSNLAAGDYALLIAATSVASREKLNDLHMANDSTPLNRAFFVRSLRTSKENLVAQFERLKFFSMVGRIGQPLVVGCVPYVAVSHPDTSYRPAVRSKVVAPKSTYGAIEMIYKFLCLNRTKPTYNQEIIYIEAESEEAARFQLSADYRLLLSRPIGRFAKSRAKHPPLQLADCPPNLTACNRCDTATPEQIHSLPTVGGCGYDVGTITYEGNCNPYSSGIFLSQIYLSQGCQPLTDIFQKAEFVKWLISRNKPSNRTNKANLSYEVVETISHPSRGGNSLLTKPYEKIKMLFKFLVLGDKRLTISIRAKSEAEARQKLQFTSPALCVARYPANFGMKGGEYA